MNDEAEWELMPHKTIEKIKDELQDLKLKAASKEVVSSESLKKSIDNLNRSVSDLITLFREASEEMKIDEESNIKIRADFMGTLSPMLKRMDLLEEENRKIAQGILAVAELVKRQPHIEIKKSSNPLQRETIKRTYSEELVPKQNMPNFELPGKAPLTPQEPERRITTEETTVDNRTTYESYNEERPRHEIHRDFEKAFATSQDAPNPNTLPPLERPMPNFQTQPIQNAQSSRMMAAPSMPPPAYPQQRPMMQPPVMPPPPGMGGMGGMPQRQMGMPPSMPYPPMQGAPMGMNQFGQPPVPPPPPKSKSGMLGGIFK